MANNTKDKLMVCFPYGFFDYSINSRDDIYKIVSVPAYKDMTPRHLKGIGKFKDEKKEVFDYITNQFVIYFSHPSKSKDEFDNWHKNFCEELCRRFIKLTGIELKFGKAQKIVNITFKHLYCFKDAETKSEHFKYCHIPIDSNVIDWCKGNAGLIPPPTAWSFIEYSDYHKFEDSLYQWLNSKNNTIYRDSNGTPYSLLQLDFIAWISIPKTRKGIIDTWRKFRNTNKLWDKYQETVLTVFPELKEEQTVRLNYIKGEKTMVNNKSKKEIIIEWAEEKSKLGEIAFDTAFCNGDKFVRYRTKKMTEIINDNINDSKIIEGTDPWNHYNYFYEVDLQNKTILRLQLSFCYRHNPEKTKHICEEILNNYKMDDRKEYDDTKGNFRWVCKFDISIKGIITEEELKNKMDQIYYMMKGYETFICYKYDEKS